MYDRRKVFEDLKKNYQAHVKLNTSCKTKFLFYL